MTKDEILEMSRKENQIMDEREQGVILRGASIAKGVGLALCILVVFLGDVLGANPASGLGAFAIYWGMYGTDRAYRWWKLRDRFDLLLAVGSFGFLLALMVTFLYVIVKGV